MAIQINTSLVADGSMKIIDEETRQSVMENRDKYLKKNGIVPENTILVKIIYETNDFCKYKVVETKDRGDGFSKPSSITADALCTDEYETALFLPIADCIGAVIYSERNHALMVSHLGRHSIEQNGAFKLFEKWHGFEPEKTENPFAYLTEIFKRGCYEEFNSLYKKKGDPDNFYKLVSLESSNDGEGLQNII